MAPIPNSAVSAHPPGLVNGTAKQPTPAAKPTIRKRIEPVIPLPYLRRPKQATAAPQLPSPLRTNSESSVPTPTKVETEKLQPGREAVLSNGSTPLYEKTPASSSKPEDGDTRVTTANTDPLPQQEPEPVMAAVVPQELEAEMQAPDASRLTPPGKGHPRIHVQGSNANLHCIPDNAPIPSTSASIALPTMSPPPLNNMRPPFHPIANQPGPFRGPMPEPIRLPSHPINQSRMHHQQTLSNGSLIFGGFHGSNASSPAPHSGGAFPPPVPMAHESLPGNTAGAFVRPMVTTAPAVDGYGPVPVSHGPLTPRSIHGSQSSRNGEEFLARPPVNGHNGLEFGRPGPPPGAARAPFPPNTQPPFSPPGFDVDEAMGFVNYISQMFARPEFADCDVVLAIPEHLTSTNSQYPGKPNGPLRLPAHGLVLAHHPMLGGLMQEQAHHSDGSREVRITSEDPFLRADSLWRAIKYVYGYRYVPLPRDIEKESDVEKFHFALGCAAAGALLDLPPISISGAREASKLVSWDTLEKGLDFALTDALINVDQLRDGQHPLFHIRYKYGPSVVELVEKIMMFLIMHFPSNFTLDTTVEDSRYVRLPTLPAESPGPQGQSKPEVGHYNPAGQNASRMSSINIKFGDMDLGDANARYASKQPGGHHTALSRILLNLPFEMLKSLLESNGLGGVPGWQTIQDRQRVMSDVVAEREARRLHFVRELMTGKYPGPVPSDGLCSKEPQLLKGPWNSVCWKEEYLPTADVPMMVRTWAPLESEF